jgi:hypothetical protein
VVGGLCDAVVIAGLAVLWLIELQSEASTPMQTTAAANRRDRGPANERDPNVRAYRDDRIPAGVGIFESYDRAEMSSAMVCVPLAT